MNQRRVWMACASVTAKSVVDYHDGDMDRGMRIPTASTIIDRVNQLQKWRGSSV